MTPISGTKSRSGARVICVVVTLAVFLPALAGCAGVERTLPQRHAIAAANPHAARAGLAMLRRGGSALDALIAAQMVLTLVEPQSSGIGGGAFLLHYAPGDPESGVAPDLRAYDGRETTPMAATPDMFISPEKGPLSFRERLVGGTATGVPGVVRMLEMAHRKHGKLPWAALFQPAIELAEKGFRITPRLHSLMRRYTKRLARFKAARRYFLTASGAPKKLGSVLVNRELAAVFRRLAAEGADAMYRGVIAKDIAAAVANSPHRPIAMTEADLAAYRAKERKILCRPYRIWRICTMPPPTSGGIATLQILTMLERFDLASMKPGSVQAVHLISEAGKLAFADRNQYVADPDFINVPVVGLLDRKYLAHRSDLISTLRSTGKASPGIPPGLRAWRHAPDRAPKPVGTSHISVIDGFGQAASMTTSVGGVFGSGLMAHGMMLNSQIADFSAKPERDGVPVVNRVEAGKRPRSSMSPTLVLDSEGRLVMAVGSPGGSSIIGYVVKSLIGALDWKLSMQDALALPNHVNRNGDSGTELEKGTALEGIAARLRAMGHKVLVRAKVSGLHGIRVT
ncbi:MAG: gamma-glutamyltransferase, partial [Alphaproteobacteria bacterium]